MTTTREAHQVPTHMWFSPLAVKPPTSSAGLWSSVAVAAALAVMGIYTLSQSAPDVAMSSRPATQIRQLYCEPLPDVPGKAVTTALVMFPPRAYTPAHRHPGSVTAYVVSGSITSQMSGTPPRIHHAGSTWFEPAGALHMFAENPSASQTAELLAGFVADRDCGPLVIPEPREPDGEDR